MKRRDANSTHETVDLLDSTDDDYDKSSAEETDEKTDEESDDGDYSDSDVKPKNRAPPRLKVDRDVDDEDVAGPSTARRVVHSDSDAEEISEEPAEQVLYLLV